METTTLRIGIALLVALFSLGTNAQEEQKTEAQFWRDAKLSFQLLENKISTEKCYTPFENTLSDTAPRVSANFHACVDAINVVLSLSGEKKKRNFALVPTARLQQKPALGKLEKSFGLASVITPAHVKGSGGKLLREALEERRATEKAWDVAFQAGDDRIDFDALLVFAKGLLPDDKVSEAVGDGLTEILMDTRDAHTTLQPTGYFLQKLQSSGDSFSGIGATLQMVNDLPIILAPLKGSPALKAGLKANDVILAVDDHSTEGQDLDAVVTWIRGPKGTDVVLTIRRGDAVQKITVTRGLIENKEVEHDVKEAENEKVGYLRLKDFMYEQGDVELASAIREMQDQNNVSSLILDLRDNPGGLLTQAQKVVGLFAPEHTKVVTQKALEGGDEEVLYSVGEQVSKLPLVILTNASSASASEIVAGALQDEQATRHSDRIFVVGERTFGKGTVQNVVGYDPETGKDTPLNSLALRFGWDLPPVVEAKTVARFILPRRNSQRFGVTPDIEAYTVPNPTEDDKARFRESDMYNNLSAQGEPWVQPRPEAVARLKSCMATQGVATKVYQATRHEAIPPEYQVLVGLDAAACLAKGAEAPELAR